MDYLGIGYSNIRLPNSDSNYIYTYDSRINIFPEEVFIHEFLHSLERTLQEYGYNIPALHDYGKYGYSDQKLIGLREWYRAYMTSSIKTNTGENVGLNSIVYQLKPTHNSQFQYPTEVDFIKEPQNIIEKIKAIIKTVTNIFTVKRDISIKEE